MSYRHGIKKASALVHKKKKDDLSDDAKDAGLIVGTPTPAEVT